MEELTWTCHICGKRRPDAKISVHKRPLVIGGQKMGEQNIRYCNDDSKCYKEAQDFEFVKST